MEGWLALFVLPACLPTIGPMLIALLVWLAV